MSEIKIQTGYVVPPIREMQPFHFWACRGSFGCTAEDEAAAKDGTISAERAREIAEAAITARERLAQMMVQLDEWHPTWGIN